MISYDKLIAKLKEAGVTSYKIKKMEQPLMAQATWTRLQSGEGGIDRETLDRLCRYFNCQPGDLMEYIPDE